MASKQGISSQAKSSSLDHPLYQMFKKLSIGAIFVHGERLEINAVVESITGYTQDEIPTKEVWFKTLCRENASQAFDAYMVDRASGLSNVVHMPFYKKDGEYRIAEFVGSILDDNELWLMRDITDVIVTAAELEKSHAALKVAERIAGVGSWAWEIESGELTWSDNLYELFEWDRDSAGEPTVERLEHELTPDTYRTMLDALQACAEAGIPYSIELQRVRKDSSVLYINALGQAVTNESGKVVKVVGTVRDITAEKIAGKQLEDAKEAAETAERAKGDFLATMSHEIRTPMNTVLGMTHLVLNTDLSAQQKSYLTKIDFAARTLIRIINDVLDFSKIEARKLELEEEEFELDGLLEAVSTVTTFNADQKGIEVLYSIAPLVPQKIKGDQMRLGQVLTNLINNAIKFTDQGRVVLEIRVDSIDYHKSEAHLEFTVSDTGIGMDSGQIDKLFQAFSQGDQQIARRYGGTGLGLSISKQLVELMKGVIWVTSEIGKGSTFGFKVTFPFVQNKKGEADDDHKPKPAIFGKRVLVVAEDKISRDSISAILNNAGAIAIHSASGASAIRSLRMFKDTDRRIDLVVIDSQMEGLSGIETASILRKSSDLYSIPIILMASSFGRDQAAAFNIADDLDGILVKPILRREALQLLENAILIQRKNNKISGSFEPNIAIEKKDREVVNLSDKRVLVVDDNSMNQEVIIELLAPTKIQVEIATNGLEAIEKIRSEHFDIVLMDVQMPIMDGNTAVIEIRKDKRFEKLPILALTAQVQKRDRDESLSAGMNEYLTKPIDETELYSALQRHLNLDIDIDRNVSVEPDVHPSWSFLDQIVSEHIDYKVALNRLDNRTGIYHSLVNAFLRDYSSFSDEIERLFSEGEMNKIQFLSHTVKSSAAYVGAVKLTDLLGKLEASSKQKDIEDVGRLIADIKIESKFVVDELHRHFSQTDKRT